MQRRGDWEKERARLKREGRWFLAGIVAAFIFLAIAFVLSISEGGTNFLDPVRLVTADHISAKAAGSLLALILASAALTGLYWLAIWGFHSRTNHNTSCEKKGEEMGRACPDSQAVVIEGGFITFTTTGRSIQEQKERYPEMVETFLRGDDPVLGQKGPAGRQLFIRNGAVPDSFGKSWDEQRVLLGEGEFVPKPWDLVDAAVAYKEATGGWPALQYWLRTDALSAYGYPIDVCCYRVDVWFSSDGVSVGNGWDDDRHSDLGLAVARRRDGKGLP